jgi:hypothetical protein
MIHGQGEDDKTERNMVPDGDTLDWGTPYVGSDGIKKCDIQLNETTNLLDVFFRAFKAMQMSLTNFTAIIARRTM